MREYVKKAVTEPRDYKERFEFRLTVGDNIICQRYFKITNFNQIALSSYELIETIQNCAHIIDDELKSKTQTYLEIAAPLNFSTVEKMEDYFKNESNRERMRVGEGIVITSDLKHDYVWNKYGEPQICPKFSDGSFTNSLTDEDFVTYKFAFLVDGREVCASSWIGVYPRDIRNSIDLSNRRGRFEGEDISKLNFDQYVLYNLVYGRTDLVWTLVKNICYTCSNSDNSWYTTSDTYGKTEYKNVVSKKEE